MTHEDIEATKAPLMDHLIEPALAADQGADRVRDHLRAVLLFRPAHLQRAGLAVRLDRGAGEFALHLHRAAGIFHHALKLAMFGAAFLSFPVIAAQVYMFVAPGLYHNERRAFLPYLIATPFFFALGAAVVYFVVLPMLVRFSLGMQQLPGRAPPKSRCCPRSASICR